jgi:hypothetical protein
MKTSLCVNLGRGGPQEKGRGLGVLKGKELRMIVCQNEWHLVFGSIPTREVGPIRGTQYGKGNEDKTLAAFAFQLHPIFF